MNDVVNSKRNSYQLTIVAYTDKFLTFAGTDSNDSYDVDIFDYQSMQILFYKLSFLTPHCTRMYPMALICFIPLSIPLRLASLPQVFELSGLPPVPNPILESHEEHSFWLLLTIPILVLEFSLLLQTALNPSLLQLYCNEPCEPINSFHLSRPSEVARYCPSAISEYRESAFLWMTINLSCWSIFIPRQILEKDVFQ